MASSFGYLGAGSSPTQDVDFGYKMIEFSNLAPLSRREFLTRASVCLGATSFALSTLCAQEPGRPLRILILGGTGFLGPACTESALARGHLVTHFNSGRTEERRR